MSDTVGAAALASVALAAGFTWMAVRTAATPVSSPDRLISELRLAQIAALLLAIKAGAYVGFAAAQEAQAGAGIDIALALGFFLIAATSLVRDPRQALTIVALAFAAHAVVDVGHRPGMLPDGLAPRWYALGCAVVDLYIGACAYLPILKR